MNYQVVIAIIQITCNYESLATTTKKTNLKTRLSVKECTTFVSFSKNGYRKNKLSGHYCSF